MTNACLECCRTVGIRKNGYCKNHHAVCIDCGVRINEKSSGNAYHTLHRRRGA